MFRVVVRSRLACRALLRALRQHGDDFLVLDLGKFPSELGDRVELGRRREAGDLIGVRFDPLQAIGCGDRNGANQPRTPPRPA